MPINEYHSMMVPEEVIMNKTLIMRGLRLVVDTDLAALYRVPIERLNELVKRDMKRFSERGLCSNDYKPLYNIVVSSIIFVVKKLFRFIAHILTK